MTLDRCISLKEGDSKGPPAKVVKVSCSKDVYVEDTVYENDKLRESKVIVGPQLEADNENGLVRVPGPGQVFIWQPGPKDDSNAPGGKPKTQSAKSGQPAAQPVKSGPPAAQPAKAGPSDKSAEEEMKLTRINYRGSMFANNTKRTATFYDEVEVVHMPTDDPNIAIDLDKLPKGAIHILCNTLSVYGQNEPAGKGSQQMEARGNAVAKAQEFSGRADVIKYDESKELVIFEAKEGNLATLYRIKVRGSPPEEIKAGKIFYWRSTGAFKTERTKAVGSP